MYRLNERRMCAVNIASFCVLGWFIPESSAQMGQATVDGAASAKSLVLLRATVPVAGDIRHLDIHYSHDGENFEEFGIGLPRPWHLLFSSNTAEDRTEILVPAVASFSPEAFRFPEAGTYSLRWQIGIEEKGGFVIEHNVKILPPLQVDLAFLAELSDPKFIRAMFGHNFFDRQGPEGQAYYVNNPDALAVNVIGIFLSDTRERVPGYVQRATIEQGNLSEAAQTLLRLSSGIPDSSYAPYAAYYAGRCFVLMAGERANEAVIKQSATGRMYDKEVARRILPDLLRSDEDVQRAISAFRFAAEHGDDYIRPLALYHLAGYHVEISELDEAERLLGEAEAIVPGTGKIEEWGNKLREQIGEIRQLESNSSGDIP